MLKVSNFDYSLDACKIKHRRVLVWAPSLDLVLPKINNLLPHSDWTASLLEPSEVYRPSPYFVVTATIGWAAGWPARRDSQCA